MSPERFFGQQVLLFITQYYYELTLIVKSNLNSSISRQFHGFSVPFDTIARRAASNKDLLNGDT